MQREKIDRNFLKFWNNIIYELSFLKTMKKIIPYAFSGFSITFIGYIIVSIFNNYPPREIEISP